MEFIRKKLRVPSIVAAIGVGGGGGNAVNHIFTHGENKISFILCNTDRQALINSPISNSLKVLLGNDGIGAGNQAAVGKAYANESIDKIKSKFSECGIQVAFIIAGMGGGTGTGAAPVIAEVARNLGILTIGVVTIPFEAEGRPRLMQAAVGIDEMSKHVDSLIIINNASIVQIYGDLPLSKAYFKSNEIISNAVKSITDIITKKFLVNVDLEDVRTVMRNSGVALMGTGVASGDDRAIEATKAALSSPLLHMQRITGAQSVLVCITSSQKPEYELTMSDAKNVPAYIQQQTCTQNRTSIIWGVGYDDSLDDKIQVTVIATGFTLRNIPYMRKYYGYDSKEEKFANLRDPLQPVRLSVPYRSAKSETNPKDSNEKDDSSVKIFYDFEDSRPAFQRRNFEVGKPRHQGQKKKSLKIDEEMPVQPKVKTASLFDDYI